MAIHEVTTTDVLQRCEACDDEHRVLIDDLEVGVAREQQVDGRLVPVPGVRCGRVSCACARRRTRASVAGIVRPPASHDGGRAAR